jgi:hypothetical protein
MPKVLKKRDETQFIQMQCCNSRRVDKDTADGEEGTESAKAKIGICGSGLRDFCSLVGLKAAWPDC